MKSTFGRIGGVGLILLIFAVPSAWSAELHFESPVKIFDSRDGYGVLRAGRNYPAKVWGSMFPQGGEVAWIAPPVADPVRDPAGVFLSITVVPFGKGNVTVAPAGDDQGIKTSFAVIGTNFSNAGAIACLRYVNDPSNQVPELAVISRFADCHLIIYLLGYYW